MQVSLCTAEAGVDSWVPCHGIPGKQRFTALPPICWLLFYSFHPISHLVPWTFEEVTETSHLGVGTQQCSPHSEQLWVSITYDRQDLLQPRLTHQQFKNISSDMKKAASHHVYGVKQPAVCSSLGPMLSPVTGFWWGLQYQDWISFCEGSLKSN